MGRRRSFRSPRRGTDQQPRTRPGSGSKIYCLRCGLSFEAAGSSRPNRIFVGDILIEGEKIAAIGFLEDIRTDLVVSATGKLVFPGAVDVHTHMDMTFQGALAADDFKSGSIAAAMGGTTTIIDFPIQQRGQDMRASLEEWFQKAEGKTAVDWGLPSDGDRLEWAVLAVNGRRDSARGYQFQAFHGLSRNLDGGRRDHPSGYAMGG